MVNTVWISHLNVLIRWFSWNVTNNSTQNTTGVVSLFARLKYQLGLVDYLFIGSGITQMLSDLMVLLVWLQLKSVNQSF